MSTPVLSLAEQKRALSAKKKKKKAIKNVLGLPSSVNVESVTVSSGDEKKICAILERLLPSAKIPFQDNKKWSKDGGTDENPSVDPEAVKQAKLRRTQLALGVNDLNRSIKKKNISAALLAGDIHPKFLVQHLNILCSHNKVPFLHLSNLRGVTKRALGFPCIALGFRKDFEDFGDAVTAVQSVVESKETEAQKETDSSSDSEVDSAEEKSQNTAKAVQDSSTEKPFTYLFRTSTEERVFIPENYSKNEATMKKENEFITLGEGDDDDDSVENKKTNFDLNVTLQKGISSKAGGNKKMNISSESVFCNDSGDDDNDDEDFDVPRKKSKMSWTIDKVGDRKNVKYSPANIIRVHSNENRKGKRK